MSNTTDNKTYYKRHNYNNKIQAVADFVKNNKNEINKIIDFGCNNGDVSKNLDKWVDNIIGIDASNDLDINSKYKFIKADIVKYTGDITNDCSIFLSLYHHILGNSGLDVADDLFYRIFFNSKYMIFDTGNLSETNRSSTYWYKKQKSYFNNEKELLDHFGLKYEIIGSYTVAGGKRNIVLFKNDENIKVKQEKKYKRMVGSKNSDKGLFDFNKKGEFFNKTYYHKITLGNKNFFTKKHTTKKWNDIELDNTIKINENIDSDKLIKFYGFNNKYGLIFEWIDSFQYSKKTELIIDNIKYVDIDIILVDGKEKYIDFHQIKVMGGHHF